jgi:Protein of unknown function (DUF4242)
MTLFVVRRELDPELNEVSRMQVTIGLIWASTFERDVRWQRSYYIDEPDRLSSLCVYEAPSAAALAVHSRRCAQPANEIRAVTEMSGEADQGLAPPGQGVFSLIHRTWPGGSVTDRSAVNEQLARLPAAAGSRVWIRSYLGEDRPDVFCVMDAADPEVLKALRTGPSDTIWTNVKENHPALWAEWYDDFGLPRHWEMRQHRPAASSVL